jgi:hypothetical protein
VANHGKAATNDWPPPPRIESDKASGGAKQLAAATHSNR